MQAKDRNDMAFAQEDLGFSTCHRILDTRLCNFAQQTAMQLNDPTLKRYPSFRFPGGLPITVETRHVQTIKRGKYLFTAKADGVRVLVVFFMYYIDEDWQRLCVMIGRDGTCHLLMVEVPTELYDHGGSLFDAELVATGSGWYHILLFDCYSSAGTSLRSLPLTRRVARCQKLVQQQVRREVDSVIFAEKPYYDLSHENLDLAMAFLNNNNHYLDYATDGLILAPPGKNDCLYGKDETQFKLKLDHTVDLIVMHDDEDDAMYFASYDESDDTYITKQQIDPETASGLSINSIIECRIICTDGIHTFTPVKARPDKTHPNSETVLQKTIRTIEDNVDIASLMLR